MTLLVDQRQDPGAGVHALIVGVSQYMHLPGEADPPRDATWGLTSLGSTAISAHGVAAWLMAEAGKLPVRLTRPLKSLRLLLSPTPTEMALLPAPAQNTTPPTRANVAQAVRDWRADCALHPDSLAFFFFAGHGFTRGPGDVNLLLTMADLLDPASTKLERTVRASNVFQGMAPQIPGDSVARHQLFFFDCCRSFPEQIGNLYDREVSPVLDVANDEGVRDDRTHTRYYAVPDTAAAFASRGKMTHFTNATLDALARGGRKLRGTNWRLDGAAIAARLQVRYQVNSGRDLDVQMVGGGPQLLDLGATAPKVDIEIHLEPPQNANGRAVALRGRAGQIAATQGSVGRFTTEVPCGEYELEVQPPQGQWTVTGDSELILPDFRNPWAPVGWP